MSVVDCIVTVQSWLLRKTRIFVNLIDVYSSFNSVEPHDHGYQAVIALALSEAYCSPAPLSLGFHVVELRQLLCIPWLILITSVVSSAYFMVIA